MASSLETNKMLAAVLTAGIIASGAGVISRIIYSPQVPEESAYPIEVAATEDAGGEAAPEVSLAALLAHASVEEGESVARKCVACHSFEQGGGNKIGPALWGVVGRDIAAADGFSYSDALASKEGSWDYESLSAFLTNPKGWAPGTKMAFAGVKDAEDRADVLLFLRENSPDAPPLPEAPAEAEAAAEGAEAQAEPAQEGGEQQVAAVQPEAAEVTEGEEAAGGIHALLAQADVAAGEAAARKCMACHSFEPGGPAKVGPPLWNVVGREIASVEGFNYSDALATKEGTWDYETLGTYLTNPREWAPGTRMAFAGIKRPEELADVVLYLRSLADQPQPLPEDG